jgi:uncharacterized protein DUF1566
VTDKTTGLMWEQKENCSVTGSANPRCAENTYTWSATPDKQPTGTLYSDFLEGLNDLKTPNDGTLTPCFANHCDWRIPTIAELRSILSAPYPTCAAPCIDPIFGPTPLTLYQWSSTTEAGVDPDIAWSVDFFNGQVLNAFTKEFNLSVRAVRGAR